MGLGFALFLRGAPHVRPAQTVLAQTETIFGPIWVWLAFGETPASATLIGGAIILAAVVRWPRPAPARGRYPAQVRALTQVGVAEGGWASHGFRNRTGRRCRRGRHRVGMGDAVPRRGPDVDAWDPAPDARSKAFAAIDAAWPAMARRGMAAGASPSRLTFHERLEDCVAGADFVQENAPEREELKQELLARIDAANPEAVVASSTSGLLPTLLAAKMARPERMLVGHPFNPVYLLPLVELVGGERTAPGTVDRAAGFYRSLGMRPLTVRKEIVGFIADRLMEALWREALWLINDDIATTEEVDAAVVYGCGLRWSLMGTFLTFHLAGGEGGMRHMLHQFGPALKLPWTKLVAPELTEALIDKVADGCADQADGRSIRELEARRDEFLVELLALVQKYWPEAEGRPGRL